MIQLLARRAALGLGALALAAPAVARSPVPQGCGPDPGPPPADSGGPLGPGLAGPLSPFPGISTVRSTRIAEADWRRWWAVHRDLYLLPLGPGEGPDPATPGGAGGPGAVGRGADAAGLALIAPALERVAESADDGALRAAALLALARTAALSEVDAGAVERRLRAALADSDPRAVEAAALGLGLRGAPTAAPALGALLVGGADAGAEAQATERLRAVGTYALGLLGLRSGSADVCRFATHLAVRILSEPEGGADAPRIAAVTALGLCPLPAGGETPDALREAPPSASREAQLAWLLAWFEAAEDGDERARSHAARSIAALAIGLADEWRAEALEALSRALDPASREPALVRQGAALALGLLGDSDGDALDRELRRALVRSAADADAQTRYFSFVALAQVAGRPGQGEGQPLEGAREARRHLLSRLARGTTAERPWAAIALGVLGRELEWAGEAPSADVDRALAASLRGAKATREQSAYALALGLRGDVERRALVARHYERMEGDEQARSELALALGLFGAIESRELLERALAEPGCSVLMLREGSVARALLGDPDVARELSETLAQAGGPDVQATAADVLGWLGAEPPVAALVAVLESPRYADSVRRAAAAALGRIASGEALHWSAPLVIGANYRAQAPALTGP